MSEIPKYVINFVEDIPLSEEMDPSEQRVLVNFTSPDYIMRSIITKKESWEFGDKDSIIEAELQKLQ